MGLANNFPPLGKATDPLALHKDGRKEISSLDEKASLEDNDVILIEDSSSNYSKKKAKAQNLGGGGKVYYKEITSETNISFSSVDYSAYFFDIQNATGSITTITFPTPTKNKLIYVHALSINNLTQSHYLSIEFNKGYTDYVKLGANSGIYMYYTSAKGWQPVIDDSVIAGYKNYNSYQYAVSIGYNAYNNNAKGIGIGNNAYNNYSSGIGVGDGAQNNYTRGVGIGYTATYNRNSGVGIGEYAQSFETRGVGIGANAYGQSKTYGVAIGESTRLERKGEFTMASAAGNPNPAAYSRWQYYGTTSDATETEIYVKGLSNNRAILRNKNLVQFQIYVAAFKDDYSTAKSWKIEGVIKRDGSGTVAFVGTPTKTVQADPSSLSWDVNVYAETDGLAIKVTGAASTNIRWSAISYNNEIRY